MCKTNETDKVQGVIQSGYNITHSAVNTVIFTYFIFCLLVQLLKIASCYACKQQCDLKYIPIKEYNKTKKQPKKHKQTKNKQVFTLMIVSQREN